MFEIIYVYRLWDFHNEYWVEDTPETRQKIDDSDDKYWIDGWMDEETYNQQIDSIPTSGNLVEY